MRGPILRQRTRPVATGREGWEAQLVGRRHAAFGCRWCPSGSRRSRGVLGAVRGRTASPRRDAAPRRTPCGRSAILEAVQLGDADAPAGGRHFGSCFDDGGAGSRPRSVADTRTVTRFSVSPTATSRSPGRDSGVARATRLRRARVVRHALEDKRTALSSARVASPVCRSPAMRRAASRRRRRATDRPGSRPRRGSRCCPPGTSGTRVPAVPSRRAAAAVANSNAARYATPARLMPLRARVVPGITFPDAARAPPARRG